jgi:hypothetical protein
MPCKNDPKTKNGLTPCLLSTAEWPVCYEHNCYQNYRCSVYRGNRPNPVRDYIPLPPVFILVGPYQAIPFSYQIRVADPEESEW